MSSYFRSRPFNIMGLVLFLTSLACNAPVSIAKFFYNEDEYDKSLESGSASEQFQNELYDEYEALVVPDEDLLGASDQQNGDPNNSAADSTNSNQPGSLSGDGSLKPVGFINYGTIDALVHPWTWAPLGTEARETPKSASAVSSANDGIGDWPNTSRYLSLPMGTYTWCIDWEEGDLDEDGEMDYFHYIEEGPTLLDENDSDDLKFAEEVAISAPPSTAPVLAGKCTVFDSACDGQGMETRIYSSPGWVIHSDYHPEVLAYANYFNYPPPDGITLTNGGGTQFQKAIILTGGQYLEATTSNHYSAMGVQPHGESIIGWARVLFDGVEVWRGDTSSYWHDAEAYLHAVYIEVRCFPPGTHTLRIEALGKEGSGGGLIVPIAYFGFRP
ncbi:MAG: hypothetical protein ABFS03_11645 [Chloroflexota bacterium]